MGSINNYKKMLSNLYFKSNQIEFSKYATRIGKYSISDFSNSFQLSKSLQLVKFSQALYTCPAGASVVYYTNYTGLIIIGLSLHKSAV